MDNEMQIKNAADRRALSGIKGGDGHQMKLKSPFFEEIKAGRKVVEMRLFDEKRRKIAVGDTILFVREENPCEQICVRVTGLHRYSTFEELIRHFSPLELGFPFFSREEIQKRLSSIYPPEKEKEYGVLAIGICLQ